MHLDPINSQPKHQGKACVNAELGKDFLPVGHNIYCDYSGYVSTYATRPIPPPAVTRESTLTPLTLSLNNRDNRAIDPSY